jgi:hypothetical protein
VRDFIPIFGENHMNLITEHVRLRTAAISKSLRPLEVRILHCIYLHAFLIYWRGAKSKRPKWFIFWKLLPKLSAPFQPEMRRSLTVPGVFGQYMIAERVTCNRAPPLKSRMPQFFPPRIASKMLPRLFLSDDDDSVIWHEYFYP